MGRKAQAIIAFSIILLVLISIGFLRKSPEKVCFESKCIDVMVADTKAERQMGLMGVEKLGNNNGMLFLFDKFSIHSFWMKNTLIPLDIIWLDESLSIVDIQTAEPCIIQSCRSYVPSSKAMYVVEVNAGFAKQHNIVVGDKASIENIKNIAV